MKKQYAPAEVLEIGNATELVLGEKFLDPDGDNMPYPDWRFIQFALDNDE